MVIAARQHCVHCDHHFRQQDAHIECGCGEVFHCFDSLIHHGIVCHMHNNDIVWPEGTDSIVFDYCFCCGSEIEEQCVRFRGVNYCCNSCLPSEYSNGNYQHFQLYYRDNVVDDENESDSEDESDSEEEIV